MHTLPLREPAFAALPAALYTRQLPEPLRQPPHWVAVNRPLAADLGLPDDVFGQAGTLAALSGNLSAYTVMPLASVYSGHQFGVYVPQLGDGRALLLGDSEDAAGMRREWQLKGAGKTPYSRFADGRAVLRSSIREYLCSEAMHGLGIPTTRALALAGSGDPVYRERQETAAVLTRIAPSFIRFGHFEYCSHRGRHDDLRALADWLIREHYPHCAGAPQPYQALFDAIADRSAELVAAWQSVGFCHGVLNTDNMSALGLTIDYGPFGFLDAYDRYHICNRSDHDGRYAYKNQPYIVHWNLSRLAAAFLPLCGEEGLAATLERFPDAFQTAYLTRIRHKLGLRQNDAGDAELADALFEALQGQGADFTLFFRRLSELDSTHDAPLPPDLAALFADGIPHTLQLWFGRYRRRLRAEGLPAQERKRQMDAVNPLYTARNHLLEQAIVQAEQGDFREIDRLQRCLADPFTERTEFADFAQAAPAWAAELCISCSS